MTKEKVKKGQAGRPKGMKNLATIEREIRTRAGVKSILNEGLLPLDVMLVRMRGQTLPSGMAVTDEQFVAAVHAAPYIHPRLTAVAYKDTTEKTPVDLTGLSMEDKQQLFDLVNRVARPKTLTITQRAPRRNIFGEEID